MDYSSFIVAAASIVVLMLAVWAVSVAISDVSIVDIAWGAGFVVVAWAVRLTAEGNVERQNLLVVVVSIWGGRLALYLAVRNLGHGEDKRYARMRRRRGDRFWLISLITVFALQGAIMWIVSLPVQIGMSVPTPDVGVLAWLGVGLWVVGLAFEAIGDWQLARFKQDPSAAGTTLTHGLWGWTRHPNYFGDACVWTGIGLIALEVGPWEGLVALIGPAVMTYFLINISGKALLEKDLVRRRPGYAEYVANTSGFFPRPPRRSRAE
ncbi:MAG: DUF1295 domain-containing protein [Acidimicrobiales bacterium]